jgi:hypothetical protein
MILGGRINPSLSSPGNRSSGLEKKAANPSEKKFGLLPGSRKISLGIWNSRCPIDMNIDSS